MAEARIKGLIETTRRWLAEHSRSGRGIEAAACAIRLRALEDALAAVRA